MGLALPEPKAVSPQDCVLWMHSWGSAMGVPIHLWLQSQAEEEKQTEAHWVGEGKCPPP